MSRSEQGHWSLVKLVCVTAVGMVLGASVFGLYRFVAADSPVKPVEDGASWAAPGSARSGPTVHVESSTNGLADRPEPILPPVVPPPVVPPPSVEAPPVVEIPIRKPEALPASLEVPVIPSLPAVPVEVKPPVPSELPAVKPTPLPDPPSVTQAQAPSEPAPPSTPTAPRLSGPTELGPFKIAGPENAPAPRPRMSHLNPPKKPEDQPKSDAKGPEIPFGPTAPLPNRPMGRSSMPSTSPPPAPSLPPTPEPAIQPPVLPAPMLPAFRPVEPAQAEKPLQSGTPANTLNAGGDGTPDEVAAPKPAPFLPEPMPVTNTPAISYPAPMLPAPGVEPMPLPTRQRVLSTTLGVALALTPATTPVVAQAPANPMPMPPSSIGVEPPKDLPKQETKVALDEESQKLLGELKTEVKGLKESHQEFESLILGKSDATTLVEQGILKRLAELEKRVSSFDDTIKRMEASLKEMASKSTSAYPGNTTNPPAGPPSNPAPASPAPAVSTKAYIRVVNDYPAEMSILINGTKSYRVASGSAQMVEVPPGSYSYELLHTGAQPKTGTIKEGETITLRIN